MHTRQGNILCGLILVIAVLAINAVIGALCWPYTVNAWLVHVGKEPALHAGHGALIALIPGIGQFSIIAAFVTWITLLIVG